MSIRENNLGEVERIFNGPGRPRGRSDGISEDILGGGIGHTCGLVRKSVDGELRTVELRPQAGRQRAQN